jgi:hypothetical protein
MLFKVKTVLLKKEENGYAPSERKFHLSGARISKSWVYPFSHSFLEQLFIRV